VLELALWAPVVELTSRPFQLVEECATTPRHA
jgi:hypothetical protein